MLMLPDLKEYEVRNISDLDMKVEWYVTNMKNERLSQVRIF